MPDFYNCELVVERGQIQLGKAPWIRRDRIQYACSLTHAPFPQACLALGLRFDENLTRLQDLSGDFNTLKGPQAFLQRMLIELPAC